MRKCRSYTACRYRDLGPSGRTGNGLGNNALARYLVVLTLANMFEQLNRQSYLVLVFVIAVIGYFKVCAIIALEDFYWLVNDKGAKPIYHNALFERRRLTPVFISMSNIIQILTFSICMMVYSEF